jgi:hypothetical protein
MAMVSMPNMNSFFYNNITTATTANVKNTYGVLHAITVNTPAAGTITVYDNTAASGTKIATVTVVTGQAFTLKYNVTFGTGLTVVTSAVMDVTVCYS